MIKPCFYSELPNKSVDASVDHFAKIPMQFGKGFSVMVKTALLTAGNPKYSLSVCNFNGDEADFKPLSAGTTSMAHDAIYSQDTFNYAYLGVKYEHDTATGYVQIYLNTDE